MLLQAARKSLDAALADNELLSTRLAALQQQLDQAAAAGRGRVTEQEMEVARSRIAELQTQVGIDLNLIEFQGPGSRRPTLPPPCPPHITICVLLC